MGVHLRAMLTGAVESLVSGGDLPDGVAGGHVGAILGGLSRGGGVPVGILAVHIGDEEVEQAGAKAGNVMVGPAKVARAGLVRVGQPVVVAGGPVEPPCLDIGGVGCLVPGNVDSIGGLITVVPHRDDGIRVPAVHHVRDRDLLLGSNGATVRPGLAAIVSDHGNSQLGDHGSRRNA